MSQEELQKIETSVNEKFPNAIITAEVKFGMPSITVTAESYHKVVSFLKNNEEFNFHFLTDLTGIQTPDEKKLGVVCHLHNMVKGNRLRVKSFVDINKPDISSLTDIFPGANWMERETFDFYGIKFIGHPNLVRILNVDEMDIFPLRKEFPLEDQTRDDKDDKMFGR